MRAYREYQAFLSSPELKAKMIANNARLAFFLHPYFKDYVDLFDIDESFTDKHGYLDVDMGEEIMKSSMMISDYSSVVWDMFYLEKPVMFYQFDQADYLKSEGAYLDYEKDLFGDVVFNASDAIDTIISYADNDFQEKPAYASMRDKYMNFHDHNNAARIYKAILKKKKLLQIENDWTFSRKVARKLWKVKKAARNKFRK
ncbi:MULTISPECIES: CDP-glycerol glycerophosphotransferase family protein [Weissella]|uniref:CDP-glycerol glycerophosphotransferase family protein n=1 Tax=Weissella TaxID=46255 RepID=UPI0021F83A39|nr:CDP-glycerol glycerophosphotransferase family protein [Weissella sp. LMG 11983]MCW0927698.1 CDP-glycerol glycerophosphotransferase family protein [Weissella sp. LMG 11983]